MKQLILSLIIIFFTFSQLSYADSIKAKLDTTYSLIPFENNAFKVGEELNFVVKWKKSFLSVTAGYAQMRVLGIKKIHNRPCYFIQVTARSTSFIENFYEVKDTIETYIDMEYGFSWRFKKITREGSYFRDLYIDYDHLNNKAIVEEIRYKDETLSTKKYHKNYNVEIMPYTQDILSSFYVLRAKRIEAGYPFKIQNNSTKKNYELNIFVNPVEDEDVEAGEFRAYKLSPQIEGESIFNQDGGMQVWVTDDSSHMPLRMKSAVKIGAVNVELESYKGVHTKYAKR